MYDNEKLTEEETMMMLKKNLGKGIMILVNAVALLLVKQTANSACIWLAHQPEFPEEANRFKM